MGFNITDLGDNTKILSVNFWNWRPTVQLINSFDIIDARRIELMGIQCAGATVIESEAHLIGQRMKEYILVKLQKGERVCLDLSVTLEPDDFVFHKDADAHKNYSATAEWLKQFAVFCSECRGFEVN